MQLSAPIQPPARNAIDRVALEYAERLLVDVGISLPPATHAGPPAEPDPWTESGLAALTGYPDNPVLDSPLPIASLANGALEALRMLSGGDVLPDYDGARLLTLRANMSGLTRNGAIAPGGSCHILACADGHIAVNLARDSDWQSLEAWLLTPTRPDWESIASRVSTCNRATLIARGRLLGLAVVDAEPSNAVVNNWFDLDHTVSPAEIPGKPARVIDLSSLWAGPLCGLLLHQAGCEVIKVEGSQRPDGARLGSTDFFDFINGDKQELSLDVHTPAGQDALRELIHDADIVIESSRPRALRQMDIHAEQLLQDVPGLTWVSITGYGRNEPGANWIAYGDDAGVAAGLSALLHTHTGQWLFCGDAIADPLTGMHAALAALASWQAGGGRLLSLSLVGTVQFCISHSNNLITDHRQKEPTHDR